MLFILRTLSNGFRNCFNVPDPQFGGRASMESERLNETHSSVTLVYTSEEYYETCNFYMKYYWDGDGA